MSGDEVAQMEKDKQALQDTLSTLIDEFENKYPTVQLAVHTRLYVENRPYDREIGGACQIHAFEHTWMKKGDEKLVGVTFMAKEVD